MDNTQSSADDSPDSTMNSRNDIEAIQMEISGKSYLLIQQSQENV